MRKDPKALQHWQQLSCIIARPKIQKKITIKEIQRVYLGRQFPIVYFTKREAECIYHLLLKKRSKQIASQLNLSVRTIESYIATAKTKLNCKRQQQLIEIITQTDFLKNYGPTT